MRVPLPKDPKQVEELVDRLLLDATSAQRVEYANIESMIELAMFSVQEAKSGLARCQADLIEAQTAMQRFVFELRAKDAA